MDVFITTILIIVWITYVTDKMDDIIDDLNRKLLNKTEIGFNEKRTNGHR